MILTKINTRIFICPTKLSFFDMAVYNNAEFADTHFIYLCANGVATRMKHLHVQAYPSRQIFLCCPIERMCVQRLLRLELVLFLF